MLIHEVCHELIDADRLQKKGVVTLLAVKDMELCLWDTLSHIPLLDGWVEGVARDADDERGLPNAYSLCSVSR
jgi:hypothetical protein